MAINIASQTIFPFETAPVVMTETLEASMKETLQILRKGRRTYGRLTRLDAEDLDAGRFAIAQLAKGEPDGGFVVLMKRSLAGDSTRPTTSVQFYAPGGNEFLVDVVEDPLSNRVDIGVHRQGTAESSAGIGVLGIVVDRNDNTVQVARSMA